MIHGTLFIGLDLIIYHVKKTHPDSHNFTIFKSLFFPNTIAFFFFFLPKYSKAKMLHKVRNRFKLCFSNQWGYLLTKSMHHESLIPFVPTKLQTDTEPNALQQKAQYQIRQHKKPDSHFSFYKTYERPFRLKRKNYKKIRAP